MPSERTSNLPGVPSLSGFPPPPSGDATSTSSTSSTKENAKNSKSGHKRPKPDSFMRMWSPIDEILIRSEGALNVEWTKCIDADTQGKRLLSIGHSYTFDPNITTGGGMYAISASAMNANYEVGGHMYNGAAMGKAVYKYSKEHKFTLEGMLPPTQVPQQAGPQGMMMMAAGPMSPEFNAGWRYKFGDSHWNTSLGTKGMSATCTRSLSHDLTVGAKISHDFAEAMSSNAFRMRYKLSKKDGILSAYDMQKRDIDMAYFRRVSRGGLFCSHFQFNHKTKMSAWKAGYVFRFPKTGSQLQATVDSDYKLAVNLNTPLSIVPIILGLHTELDHFGGQHKVGLTFRVQVPSEEQMMHQMQQMQQAGMM